MFRMLPAAAAMMFGIGTALGAPNGVSPNCFDPAVVAAIDGKEASAVNENRLPGSGLSLSSLPAFAGIRLTDHRIEVVSGEITTDPNVLVCRVKLRLQALTPNGVKTADENFIYRIERTALSYDVKFCPNGYCGSEKVPAKLADRAR